MPSFPIAFSSELSQSQPACWETSSVLVLSHESEGKSEESHVSDYLLECRNVQHKAHCLKVELIRPCRANILDASHTVSHFQRVSCERLHIGRSRHVARAPPGVSQYIDQSVCAHPAY